jgi:hypothetical protein
MPGPRRLTKSDEALALDEAARTFSRIQKQLDVQRETLHAACVAAVRSGMSKSEVGRRAGYTREYVGTLVSEAEKAEAAQTE